MAKKGNKIAPLNNEYHKAQLAKFQAEQKRLTYKRRRLSVILILALVILGFSAYHVLKDGSKLMSLRNQETEMTKKEAELAKKETDLSDDVSLLKDEDYLGKLARSRYLLSKDGEKVYTVPSESVADTTDQSSTSTSTEDK